VNDCENLDLSKPDKSQVHWGTVKLNVTLSLIRQEADCACEQADKLSIPTTGDADVG